VFLKIMEKDEYNAADADEMRLFWKMMPSCTYNCKEEATAPRFMAAKDKITFLQ
jgi:hypothetical protein